MEGGGRKGTEPGMEGGGRKGTEPGMEGGGRKGTERGMEGGRGRALPQTTSTLEFTIQSIEFSQNVQLIIGRITQSIVCSIGHVTCIDARGQPAFGPSRQFIHLI